MTGPTCERVVLVGFMGAGKSTVGRNVAAELGWLFVDLDAEIESTVGCTIPDIFDRFGEPYFRRVESETGKRVLSQTRVVVATGGGWPVRPGAMEGLPPATVAVWLRVTFAEALRRASLDRHGRPLLSGVQPVGEVEDAVKKHFDERVARYSLAGWAVDTEGRTVEDVTAHVLEIVAETKSETETE